VSYNPTVDLAPGWAYAAAATVQYAEGGSSNMPTVNADTLENVTREILRAVDTPEEDARVTAHIIVESNLTGHESHGVVALPRYLDFIRKGYIVPGAPTETVAEGPSYALIDGHKNFGHIVAYRATQMAIEKAYQESPGEGAKS